MKLLVLLYPLRLWDASGMQSTCTRANFRLIGKRSPMRSHTKSGNHIFCWPRQLIVELFVSSILHNSQSRKQLQPSTEDPRGPVPTSLSDFVYTDMCLRLCPSAGGPTRSVHHPTSPQEVDNRIGDPRTSPSVIGSQGTIERHATRPPSFISKLLASRTGF